MNTQGTLPVTRKENVTRNFEQMAKLPAAEGLKEARAELTPGFENVWYEYVPKSYTGEKAVPLVVQLHGGGNDGRRWVAYTAWHMLAEKEGFIVVYPNSIHPEMWLCDQRDVEYIAELIKLMRRHYRIDESRVYVQGMSNGEMMTLAFTMAHPEMLAAAGNMTGPSPQEMIGDERPIGALPLIQMRGEKDVFFKLPDPPPEDLYAKRYGMNDFNREIWLGVNGVKGLPALSVRGKDNFLYYRGSAAPIINWEIAAMGHREPADGAQVFWDYLYSGCVRQGGKPVFGKPNRPLTGDTDSAIVAVGSNKAYKADHLEELSASVEGYARSFGPPEGKPGIGEMFETEGIYVPIEGLKALFGAKTELISAGDAAAAVFPDGTRYEFLADSLLVVENGRHRGLRKPCVLFCGLFYVPVEEIARDLLGLHVSSVEGVLLISGHYGELGRYTARILKKLMM